MGVEGPEEKEKGEKSFVRSFFFSFSFFLAVVFEKKFYEKRSNLIK